MIIDLARPAALLVSAWLFGGMLLFAAGFAAFLFKVMPVAEARTLIRKAFPPFYLFVIGTAALAALLLMLAGGDQRSVVLLAVIAATTVPTRQALMPAINRATDRGDRRQFAVLHGVSVLITLAHIAAVGVVLVRLAG
ncbi:MAG: DUF4149 domain-containing protein [Nevskia sp.]|nr:DUF4149 domain-containing protein [Nevskia sp.]